jgi:hypothetical protein
MGRRKSHSLRESNDPHAEGWDARSVKVPREANPYILIAGDRQQRTDRHKKMQNHNVALWFLGWDECAESLKTPDIE